MAITLVGRQVINNLNLTATSRTVSFALTDGDVGSSAVSPAAGDFVCIFVGAAHTAGATRNLAVVGYTADTNRFFNDNADTDGRQFYARMGATPDTTFTITNTTGTGPVSVVIYVFRGVDEITPLDIATVTGGAVNGGQVSFGSMSIVTAGTMVVNFGASAIAVATAYAYGAGLTTNRTDTQQVHQAIGTIGLLVGGTLRRNHPVGALSTATWDIVTRGNNAADSRAYAMIALRPAPEAPAGSSGAGDVTAAKGTGSGIGFKGGYGAGAGGDVPNLIDEPDVTTWDIVSNGTVTPDSPIDGKPAWLVDDQSPGFIIATETIDSTVGLFPGTYTARWRTPKRTDATHMAVLRLRILNGGTTSFAASGINPNTGDPYNTSAFSFRRTDYGVNDKGDHWEGYVTVELQSGDNITHADLIPAQFTVAGANVGGAAFGSSIYGDPRLNVASLAPATGGAVAAVPSGSGTGHSGLPTPTGPEWDDVAAVNNAALPYTLWGKDWRANVAQTAWDLMSLTTDNQVAKLEARVTDVRSGDPSDRHRAEVSGSPFPWAAADGDRVISFSQVPLQLPTDITFTTLMQQFDLGFNNPMLKLDDRGDLLTINVAGDAGTVRDQITAWEGSRLELGKRYNHVFRIRASGTGGGEVDWWVNGTLVMSLRNILLGSGASPSAYEKIGVYVDDDSSLGMNSPAEVIVFNYESASGAAATTLLNRVTTPLATPTVIADAYPLGSAPTGTTLIGGGSSGAGAVTGAKPTASGAGVKTGQSGAGAVVAAKATVSSTGGRKGSRSTSGAATAPKATASSTGGFKGARSNTAAATAPKPTATGTGTVKRGSGAGLGVKPTAAGTGTVKRGSGAVVAKVPVIAGAGEGGEKGSGTGMGPKALATGTGRKNASGSGAGAAKAPTATGAGLIGRTGSGAAVAPVAVASGNGTKSLTGGAGAVTGPKPTATGQGTKGASGTGAVVARKATASGSGIKRGQAGSGAVTAPKAGATGAGRKGAVGSGAVVAPKPSVTASGRRNVTGSGAGIGPKPQVTGAGTVKRGSGAALAPKPTASGTGSLNPVAANGTGNGLAPVPVVAASGTKQATGSGGVNARKSTASGTGRRNINGTGAAVGVKPTASGTGTKQAKGTGVAVAPKPVAAGTGEKTFRTFGGDGTVIAAKPVAAGTGRKGTRGTGAVQAKPATASGAGRKAARGTGAALAPKATAAGSGRRSVVGQGQGAAVKARASGAGFKGAVGAGATVAPIPHGQGFSQAVVPPPDRIVPLEPKDRVAVFDPSPNVTTLPPDRRVHKVKTETRRIAKVK